MSEYSDRDNPEKLRSRKPSWVRWAVAVFLLWYWTLTRKADGQFSRRFSSTRNNFGPSSGIAREALFVSRKQPKLSREIKTLFLFLLGFVILATSWLWWVILGPTCYPLCGSNAIPSTSFDSQKNLLKFGQSCLRMIEFWKRQI